MPIIDIQQLSKLYYSIGEVSKLLDVNPSLLRFWEKEFQLEVSKKNKKGIRSFTVKEIEKINKIYKFVKVEGYTLDGAKKALKLKEEKLEKTVEYDSNKDLVRRLEAIRVKLLSLKKS